MLKYIAVALLTLAAPIAASALPMTVGGGVWTPLGGAPEGLSGSLDLEGSVLSLALSSATTQIVGSSLAVAWSDADTFSIVGGQSASVNGVQVGFGGTCNGSADALTCGLIANGGALRGTITGLTAVAVSPMPEPHAMALFAVGALFVGSSIRRYA